MADEKIPLGGERIIPINIEEEMKTAYIDYSMSVIVSRAIPDVRDGLKPVQRRVLFGMNEMGNNYNKAYKKSARVVGEVMGKFHPHGDSSVYDAMVRMAQEWTLRYPLIDGQGNFGSVDGDPPAAMRYTEVRLQRIAEEMLADIDKETVDFQLNFDDTLKEPIVLPSKLPNLLMNGASGIAVGMATNILPHNLTEIVNGLTALIDDKDLPVEKLLKFIKAPDFPTGGIIYGYDGVKDGFLTGRGKVVVRGKAEIETMKNGRERIIVTEIPYQVNKAQLIQKTYELMADKKMEGISEIRDESDRDGMRIVYELKRDVIPNIVLNQLYTYTSLQTSFGINNVCLDKGRPKLLNLKDMLQLFIDFRMDVLIRRTKFELAEAEKRAHILEGLLIAIDNLDAVIKLIRASETPDEALKGLMEKFKLSELQGKAILDMTLRRLTGLERDKIKQEFKELMAMIDEYNKILRDETYRFKLIKDEMLDIKDRYGDDRRTQIVRTTEDINIEDLIPEEDVVITISRLGYLKRTSLTSYRRQNRGGKGAIGGSAREEDFIEYLFVASTHNYMLLFTEKGRCYWLKVYEIPEANKTAKGRAIQNLINMPSDDKIKAFINVKNLTEEEYLKNNFIIFCTKNGVVKKTTLEDYSNPRASGINAISIRDNDHLMEVKMTNGTSEVVIAVKSGKAIRFNESNVRAMGRTAAGVRGINLDSKNDEVVGMICVDKDDKTATIMVVSEKGYGKRTDLDEYRVIHRGGKGVKTLNVTPKTGKLIAIKDVTDDNDLMIINRSGVTIRMSVKDIKVQGRNTQGVRLIKLNDTDEIAAVAKINEQPEINSGGDDGEGDDQGDMFKDKE